MLSYKVIQPQLDLHGNNLGSYDCCCPSQIDLLNKIFKGGSFDLTTMCHSAVDAQMHNREGDSDDDEKDDSSDKLTLSGVLNLVDGLWSTCGDERIIIFTTNHKEKLDPALLRPGRMDMHIHMGYCTPEGFDVLAFNYLGINDQPRRVLEIKELIREIEITPAEIAEHLMRNEDVDLALEGVIDLLKQKREEKNSVIVEKEAKENKTDKDGDEYTEANEEKKRKMM
ncbi:hypothetical protein CASFOL_026340 [Castilleja foliolosa]|uniref:ATPase AAA-type core domain-containing protein n=1 Tax=Castilleja foliolosa TaxID=1961234 RepID=A0ABD3CHN4_9LAMI